MSSSTSRSFSGPSSCISIMLLKSTTTPDSMMHMYVLVRLSAYHAAAWEGRRPALLGILSNKCRPRQLITAWPNFHDMCDSSRRAPFGALALWMLNLEAVACFLAPHFVSSPRYHSLHQRKSNTYTEGWACTESRNKECFNLTGCTLLTSVGFVDDTRASK